MSVKIFHWAIPEGNEVPNPAEYAVTEGDGTITLSFTIPYRGFTLSDTVAFNIEECKESVKEVVIYEAAGDITRVLDAFVYCDRTGYNIAHPCRTSVARVVFDDEGNVFIFLKFRFNGDIEGYENIPMERTHGTHTTYLLEYSPWFKEFFMQRKKKALMLRETDPYKSISYLEAQIDLLTKVVSTLIAGGTPDEETMEALQAAETASVLNIKPMSAVKEEFTKSKADFRKLQEAYYERLKE